MKNEITINNCDKIIIKATKARNKVNKKENTITTKESGYIILYRIDGEYKTAVEVLGGNTPENLQGVISTTARNIALEAAYSAAGLECPPAIVKAAKAERKAAKERDKKREERESGQSLRRANPPLKRPGRNHTEQGMRDSAKNTGRNR